MGNALSVNEPSFKRKAGISNNEASGDHNDNEMCLGLIPGHKAKGNHERLLPWRTSA